MAVNIDWRLATAQPNMLAIGNAGFQQGQQQAMQRREQQALQAYAANPDDEAPVNALLAVNPQLAGQLGGMQGQRRRDRLEQDRQEAFRGAIRPDGSVDNNALGAAYLQSGDAKGYIEFQRTRRQAEKDDLEMKLKGVEVIGQLVGGVTDQASYEAAIGRAQELGLPVGNLPPQYDPGYIQGLQRQAVDVKTQLEQKWKELGFNLDVARFGETVRSNRTRESLTAAQIAAADRRAAMGAGGGAKAPSGYRFKPDGTLEAIPGGPASTGRQLTEVQAKSGGFLRLAQKAEETLSKIGGATEAPGELARFAYAVPFAERAVSPKDRQVLAAQAAFAEASLRFLTGAAVTKDEAKANITQFYPSPGDTPEVIEQKAGYRAELLDAMRVAAGPAAPPLSQQRAPTPRPATSNARNTVNWNDLP